MNSRDTIEAAAQRFLLKGQTDRALAEYQRLLAEDPNDVRTLLKIGDLEVKLNNITGAISAYMKVAEHHSRQGFSLKAVAVLKQVVKLDPQNMMAATRLAGLYEQLGLISEAVQQQQAILAHHQQRNEMSEMAVALGHLDALQGPTADSFLLWAHVHQRQGRNEEACAALRSAMEQFKALGQQEAWSVAAERLLEADPHLTGLACELARHYLARQEPKRALLRLQQAFRAAPQDTETLTLLAQVFEAIDQIPKAITVLHELATQAKNRRQEAAHRRILEHILRLDPEDAQAKAAQQQTMTRVINPSDETQAPTKAPVDLGKLMIEAQVFVRYGLRQRAIEYLDRVLAAFPGHPEATSRRKDLLADIEKQKSASGTPNEVVFAFDVEPSVDDGPHGANTLVRHTTVGRSDEHLKELGADIDQLVAAADNAASHPLAAADPLPPPAPSAPPKDVETHMNLGTAYREMGLFEEALAQFVIASESPQHQASAWAQKGIVLGQLGRSLEALAAFEQALGAPNLSNAQAAMALYESGSVYEAQGTLDKARQAFAKCQAIDSSYQDVGARLKKLREQAEGVSNPAQTTLHRSEGAQVPVKPSAE